MRRLRAMLAGVAAAGLLVTGCTDDSTAEPEPTRWGPELSQREAYERIPLAGPEEAPLYWRVPEIEDEELVAALSAAQHLIALDYYRYASDMPYVDSYLYQWLATDRMLDVHYPDGPPDPDVSTTGRTGGPIWLWVMVVESGPAPSQVLVSVCMDRGWHGRLDRDEKLPKSNRAFMEHYQLYLGRRDGERIWLVDRVWADRDQHGPEVRRECEEWATHEPGDE